GDVDGARVAMLQAEQATSTPGDRATIATLIGDQLLASRDLAGAAAPPLRPVIGDQWLASRDLAGAAAAYDRARSAAPGLTTTEIGRARVAAAQGRLGEGIPHL